MPSTPLGFLPFEKRSVCSDSNPGHRRAFPELAGSPGRRVSRGRFLKGSVAGATATLVSQTPFPARELQLVIPPKVPTAAPKRVRALEQIRRMRGGSQPHLMRCSDGSYYVVKFQNNPQDRRILVNEWLGTALAARLGLPTTRIAV